MYIKSLYNTKVLVHLKYINNEDNVKKHLLKNIIKHYGNRCNMYGFLSNNNINIIEYTIGELYRNYVIYNVLYEGIISLPVVGTILNVKITSDEGLFYVADYDIDDNNMTVGKIFIMSKKLLNVNNVVDVIVSKYFFNNKDKNIYLFAKYIEDKNYIIPEIPTKEECDKYLNLYLKNDNNIFYNINSSLNSNIDSDLSDNHTFKLDDVNLMTETENVEEDTPENVEEDKGKIEGGLNENISSEYRNNISNIELESQKRRYKLLEEGGLSNLGFTSYLNSVLHMMGNSDIFMEYLDGMNEEYVEELKKYYSRETKETFETALMVNNLNVKILELDLYKQNRPDIFLDELIDVVDNNNVKNKVFYNFKNVGQEQINIDNNLVIDKEQQLKYNSEYDNIEKYVEELSFNNKLRNILIQKKYCINCNYDTVEVNLINYIDLYYNNEKSLQEIINNNKVIQTENKCKICNKYNYMKENKYELLNNDIIFVIKNKLNKNINFNRTIQLNKMRGKIMSYMLKTPNNSEEPHYRVYNKENKILYDDDKIYKLNNFTKDLVEDIYMIHIKFKN